MTCGIYKITNLVNGKVYIGKTVDFLGRKYTHLHCARKGRTKSAIHRAMKKYGIENFAFEMVEELPVNGSLLSQREIFWISHFNSRRRGYNMTDGGEGLSGYECSDEHRRKTSEASKKMWLRPGVREAIVGSMIGNKYRSGIKHTEDTRKRMSSASAGKPKSEKHCVAISIAKKRQFAENPEARNRYIGRENPAARSVVLVEMCRVFETVKSAGEFVGIQPHNISAALGGHQKTAGGYRWMYYDDWVKTQEQAAAA